MDLLRTKINFDNTSENLKCGNYKKSRVIYHYEEKRVTILLIFMVIFEKQIMQNYQKNHQKKRVMVITPDIVVITNG